MARELGDARRGEDGDVGNAGMTEKKVEVDSAYMEKLRERLKPRQKAAAEPFTIDGNGEAECAEEPAKPAFVTYGPDGKPE
jgi:hypothetical protein